MHRRNFFAILFGGLLAKWLPSQAMRPFAEHAGRFFYFGGGRKGGKTARITRVDELDMSSWGGPLTVDPLNGEERFAQLGLPANAYYSRTYFVTRNGYVTAPSSPQKWTAHVKDLPIGPPNVIGRIISFDD